MTEKPILFSGPMVRQILAGVKTQTRRPVKPQPEHGAGPCHWSPTGWAARSGHDGNCTCQPIRCPYAADRLWVREAWRLASGASGGVRYRADEGQRGPKWRPSIHMPRWASRLTLDVLSIRVERLHDISEADIIAEGVTIDVVEEMTGVRVPHLRDAWRLGWKHTYGAEPWNANPWLWVIEFRRPEVTR